MNVNRNFWARIGIVMMLMGALGEVYIWGMSYFQLPDHWGWIVAALALLFGIGLWFVQGYKPPPPGNDENVDD